MLEGETYLDWAHEIVEDVVTKKHAGCVSDGTVIVLAFTIRQ